MILTDEHSWSMSKQLSRTFVRSKKNRNRYDPHCLRRSNTRVRIDSLQQLYCIGLLYDTESKLTFSRHFGYFYMSMSILVEEVTSFSVFCQEFQAFNHGLSRKWTGNVNQSANVGDATPVRPGTLYFVTL